MTAWSDIQNIWVRSNDNKETTGILLWDLSAAFDTLDCNILCVRYLASKISNGGHMLVGGGGLNSFSISCGVHSIAFKDSILVGGGWMHVKPIFRDCLKV